MMDNRRADITVAGKTYRLMTSDTPEYIKEIAKELDGRISKMLALDDTLSVLTATTIVALEILDEGLKTNSNIDNIRTQIKTYVEDAAKSRMEAEEYKTALAEKDSENKRLTTELELLSLKNKI
ncbi:MAG: cell division protein ZapA [Oscillospiraceae bacterium]|nr:cell division protein ZapA [Oscillospiraceae bacterium]